ncbi:ribbon-helix-helix domain-containing protein [Peribacillus sp. TH24]|uniref:ribbon-helix-helix domain-containing protein n=1 Tax=Peribacillus sp. TH24 TaxID=2798483 RepID=UPI0019114A2F|nr:ribbon-helix-helix domain-containing protein [Peribacillus sp. TH24]MBK5447086.1 ribbon-helix-helix domain-containing protein [Peribacillus sp. TH24]MBK5447099.1 ribbon-helix-helix domain-containing protein [Peribacillus sp. TH24]
MKIKEILDDLLITGNTIAKIAKEKVHIGEKKLKEALHNAGYEYRNSGQKGWYYIGEGEEPLYTSVFEFIKSNNSHPKVKQTTPIHAFNLNQSSHDLKRDSHPIPLDVNSARTQGKSSIHTEFTPEERAILRDLIREYVLNDQQDSHGDDLYQRVVTLEKGKKVRKTIVINEEVGALLDSFADQQKINKSDLIEIAILDLIKKYK